MRNFLYIICEFDPPHKGHAHLIESARAAFPDSLVVCVMSGHLTERGSPASLDKFTRAKAALYIGADLVLSLPFPYCSSSAEYFARGGAAVIKSFAESFPDVTHTLAFGSECGDTKTLVRAAANMSSDEYRARLYEDGEGGHNARSMQTLYEEMFDSPFPDGPNDMLGVEYIRALADTCVRPYAVRRVGARHDGDAVDGIASASAIREMMSNDTDVSDFILADAHEIIMSAVRGRGVASETRFGDALLPILRLTDPDEVDDFAECGGGVGRRIIAAAKESRSFGEMMSLSATKKYTNARLRRAAAFAALRIPQSALHAPIVTTQLLAANARGISALHRYRGDVAVTSEARLASALDARLDALYTLAYSPALPYDAFLRTPPVIVRK